MSKKYYNVRVKCSLMALKAVFFIIVLIISSCNLTYKVRNQHNDIENILYIPCGRITVELVGKGNSIFVFKQNFKLDDNVTVFKDSLKIFYNEKEIVTEHNIKNGEITNGGIEISENKLWESSFRFEKGVFEGDVIKVYGPGYLMCQDQVVTLDTMVYSFANSLRIYGVNKF